MYFKSLSFYSVESSYETSLIVSISPIAPRVPASRWDSTTLSSIIYSALFWSPVRKDGVVLSSWVQIDRAFIKYTTSMVNAQGWEILKARAKNSTTYTSIFYTTLIQSEMSMRCVYETFLHCTMLHVGGGGNKSRNSKTNFWDPSAPIWLDIMHVFKQ